MIHVPAHMLQNLPALKKEKIRIIKLQRQ